MDTRASRRDSARRRHDPAHRRQPTAIDEHCLAFADPVQVVYRQRGFAKADQLANLWDNDAVRIQPGHPAEVSKAVIYANDKHWEASKGNQKTLCGEMEIQDLQIAGDWAFEWAYFSYKENTAEGKVSTGQGKVLRVLHRQVDGSWKFARVMNFTEKLPTDAPVSHPCE